MRQVMTNTEHDRQQSELFTPIAVGSKTAPNRVWMAPMTRGRARQDATPTEVMVEYYRQRATAGLIITEATAVSAQGYGWLNSPGLFTDEHVSAWRRVTDAVHEEGGTIFVQLWHMGSVVHPDFFAGEPPVAPSAVRQEGEIPTPQSPQEPRALVTPRGLETSEIASVVDQFRSAFRRAIDAGFDGVEIHAANGFLVDQFLRSQTNLRSDDYGGSIDNRARFLLEVVDAAANEVGSDRVGVRISPTNAVWGIADDDPLTTFSRVAELLNDKHIAYLHVLEPITDEEHFMKPGLSRVRPLIRAVFDGLLLGNGGYDFDAATADLAEGNVDAVAFGTPFIANPDLVDRFVNGHPLNGPNPETFYTPGAEGYIDYPAWGDRS
jgi:N-ethylmaleimide reductase